MKKITALAFSVAVSATAMAQMTQTVEPVEAKDFSAIQIVERSNQTIADVDKATFKEGVLNTKAVPDGATVNPFCKYPAGTFFPYNLFGMGGGTYMYPSVLIPAYAELDWQNYTYYVDPESGKAKLATNEYTWDWTYTDFNGNEATSTDVNLKTVNQPSAVKSYLESPILMASADGTIVYETHSPIVGGDGALKPWFEAAMGATDLECPGSYLFDVFADDLFTMSMSGEFGTGASAAGSGWEYWANSLAAQGASNFRVMGMAQEFEKPAAPYALKKVSLMAFVDAQAGAELDFTFFKMSEEGTITNEVVHQCTYTFPEAYNSNSTGMYCEIPVEITSEDEFGFELDYKIIDCGMVMVVTGYDDGKFNEFDIPAAFFLDEQPNLTVNGTSLYALGAYDYNGGTYVDLFDFPYLFYTDATRSQLMAPTHFRMTVDVEYPYLMTYANYTTMELVEPAAEHNVNLKAGETALYGLLCYGKADDILYTTADGSDFPEWLEIELVDQEDENFNEDVLVSFTVAADADDTEKSCDIVLSYKGQNQTFKIAQSTSGIEDIAADTDAAPKYYNLQGMEVANPENGFYIVKRGNKVAKEMFVK